MEDIDVMVDHEKFKDGSKNHLWSEKHNCIACKKEQKEFDKKWMQWSRDYRS